MDSGVFLYGAIVILLFLYVVFSSDDLVWDFYYLIRGKKKRRGVNIEELDTVPVRLLAILIPAWKEQDVIKDMVENNLSLINYPLSLFHVFLGVYENDEETSRIARELEGRYPNVHAIVNGKQGPTSKAQNLNNMLRGVRDFERSRHVRFAAVLIHDAEDVLHSTSLKLANYLVNQYDVVQFPVFPLQPYPRLRTFFRFLTASTYADEFAENHYRGLPARCASGAFVPSAGTGFLLSRRVLDVFEGRDLFEEQSVTEAYRFSLLLEEHGFHTYFFLERVYRLESRGRVVAEYIATREIFPNTYREAVKQKSRWIYGIAFQSFSLWSSLLNKKFSWITKYSLYRDWKAKVGNLLTLPGYFLFFYAMGMYFWSDYVLWSVGSLPFWLGVILSDMMVERQVMRAIAIHHVYGWRSAILASFAPPFLPIRMVWGNIINFSATLVAWRVHFFGFPKRRPRWQKTKRTYLSPQVIARYRRRLGDLLLEKNSLDTDTLFVALKEAEEKGEPLGVVLRGKEMVSQEKLLQALAENLKMPYIRLEGNHLVRAYPQEILAFFEQRGIVPLALTPHHAVIAAREPLSLPILQEVEEFLQVENVTVALATEEAIREGLRFFRENKASPMKMLLGEMLLEAGFISGEELLEALRVQAVVHRPLGEIFLEMGVLTTEDLEEFLKIIDSA